MTYDQFDQIFERRVGLARQNLIIKAGVYASNQERLYNFKECAKFDPGLSPADALQGMARKHWVRLMDLVRMQYMQIPIDRGTIDETLGDAYNYLHLLEAVLVEPLLIAESRQPTS